MPKGQQCSNRQPPLRALTSTQYLWVRSAGQSQPAHEPKSQGLGTCMASKKSERLVVRLSPDDRALLERVAAADELEVSTWVRRTAVQAARRSEKDRESKKEG